MSVVLMSIKPEFSCRIFAGEKKYELRRTPVRFQPGDIIVVYASSPVKAIVGAFIIGGVSHEKVSAIWEELGEHLGVSSDEYFSYFGGSRSASAIQIEKAVETTPVPLAKLRSRVSGFRPPQSYMYWRRDVTELLDRDTLEKLIP